MADKKQTPKTSSKSEKEVTKSEKKAASNPTGAKKIFASIKQFFKDVKGETKKIVWNSRQDTIKNTGIVLMVTVIVGAGVWVADFAFRELVEYVVSLAEPTNAIIMLQNIADLL